MNKANAVTELESAAVSVVEGHNKPDRRHHSPTFSAVAPPLVILVIVLIVWQYIPQLFNIPKFVFPTFTDVLSSFTTLDNLGRIASNALTTIAEALSGFVVGSILAIFLGFVLAEFDTLRRALYPFIVAAQSLPKVAVAPLLVIWFGFGPEPKVLLVALLSFFPVFVNTMTGITSVDSDRLDLFRSLCASRGQTWRKLLLPSALPSIFAGLEVAVVFSLLGAIVGEFVTATSGLGVLLQQQQANYDTAGAFSVLLVLSAIGVIFNQSIVAIRKRVIFWHKSSK